MSKQYLEAHTFLKALRDEGVPYTETLVNLMQYAVIEDVAPVVHAHWEDCSNGWMCSNCYRDRTYETDYCPNCGAKMDEVE